MEWQHTPVFLPGEFHGQESLSGYSPWGHKESDMTEMLTHIHTHTHTHTHSFSLSLSLKEGAFLRMYVFIVLLSTDSEAITIPGRLKSTVLIIIEGCGTSSSRNADCLIYSS